MKSVFVVMVWFLGGRRVICKFSVVKVSDESEHFGKFWKVSVIR